MEVEFDDDNLDRLETDRHFSGGYSQDVVVAFRRRMQQIRAAWDELDLSALKSMQFESLTGRRGREHAVRLNAEWLLVLQLQERRPCKIVGIVEIRKSERP